MRQRGRSERRNCQRKCFHSFNYIIDHASIRVFFYVNSLHCSCDSFYTTCYILAQIALQLSQAYSHTSFLFEYMNFLKIIHEKEFFVM